MTEIQLDVSPDRRTSGRVAVVNIAGFKGALGVRAAQSIRVGDVIGYARGVFTERNALTVAVGESLHLLMPEPFVRLNHSCAPSAAFAWPEPAYANAGGAHESRLPSIIAFRDISEGEEITFDYASTEWELASSFECNCKSSGCVGTVRGYKFLDGARREALAPQVAPHIERLFGDELASEIAKRSRAQEAAERLRIAVLVSSYALSSEPLEEVDCPATPALHFEPLVGGGSLQDEIRQLQAADAAVDPKPVVKQTARYEFSYMPIHKATAETTVATLIASGRYDCFFNLCDGAGDTDTAGIEVVSALEKSGVPYTGAAPAYYEPTKVEMKAIVASVGLNVPKFFVVTESLDGDALERRVIEAGVRFPLIVKHISGYASVGMTKASRCQNHAELVEQVGQHVGQYGPALVEEFIEGDEVTVLACEGPSPFSRFSGGESRAQTTNGEPICTVFVPVQMKFPEGESFKHYDLKWVDYKNMEWMRIGNPVREKACREAGRLAFVHILGGRGYGRTDLRVGADGRVWFLEINPNCAIFYPTGSEGSADSILRLDPTCTAAQFAEQQIATAMQRAGRRKEDGVRAFNT